MPTAHEVVPPANALCGEPRCGHPATRGHPRQGWVRFYEVMPYGQETPAIWFCTRRCMAIWLVAVEQVLPSPLHEEDKPMEPSEGLRLLNAWSGLGLNRRDVTAQRVNRAASIACERLAAEHEQAFQAIYVPLIERAYEAALDFVEDAMFGGSGQFDIATSIARTSFDNVRDLDLAIAHMLKNPPMTFHGACIELGFNSGLTTELSKIYESLKELAS